MKDSALVEHLHARGYRIEITDLPMIREAHAALAAQPEEAVVEKIKALVAYHGHVSPAFAEAFYAIVGENAIRGLGEEAGKP